MQKHSFYLLKAMLLQSPYYQLYTEGVNFSLYSPHSAAPVPAASPAGFHHYPICHLVNHSILRQTKCYHLSIITYKFSQINLY